MERDQSAAVDGRIGRDGDGHAEQDRDTAAAIEPDRSAGRAEQRRAQGRFVATGRRAITDDGGRGACVGRRQPQRGERQHGREQPNGAKTNGQAHRLPPNQGQEQLWARAHLIGAAAWINDMGCEG